MTHRLDLQNPIEFPGHAMTLECSFNGSSLENDVPWGGAVMPEWNLPRAQLCVPLMGLFPYVSLYKKCISIGTETIKLTFHGVGLLFRPIFEHHLGSQAQVMTLF